MYPIAIFNAPSILPSSFSFAAGFDAAGAAPSARSISCNLVSSVSRLLRYAKTSFPVKNAVELDERACRAKNEDEDAIDGSTTVTTLEKFEAFKANGETVVLLEQFRG